MAYVKAAERHEQIVAAAIRVLSRVGVPGTTLRAVATEAGIPLGTLHYVFPSKDQLLRAVIAAVIDDVVATVHDTLQLDRGLAHALRHGVAAFWEALVEGDVGVQVMQYELAMYSVRTEGSQGLARLQYDRYSALVTEFCEQAARTAGERCAVDFATLGRLALGMLDGLIIQYIASPDGGRARRDLDRAIQLLVTLADPRPVRAVL
ncbi:TetR/AcrR family transcriptional regulator [Mycobacterium sp. TNTM28]|uniref:TetR/AcrR family transcriptional regulator n=1 Tax=[Mycobacterium] fortunisiensis TaxID=2600579 RepID=A0ABS6KK51_9MYCO|nr:TetR/AcrR family transcriptional regulator [[Mycobacterium] fortunisiensis]MBU9763960.1 TetR/AcrR family transcriptional regulator [[Mycobacterium] fortunisiensis]